MTLKPRGIAILAAATAIATSLIGAAAPVMLPVQRVVFGAPLPLDPAATETVPTADEMAGLLGQLTDPNTSDPDKSNLVEGGLSADELSRLDQNLSTLSSRGFLPFAFDVTDFQPAANNLAGVTVSLTGPRMSIPAVRPMVLVNQNGNWKLTHDTYDPTFIQEIQQICTWTPWGIVHHRPSSGCP